MLTALCRTVILYLFIVLGVRLMGKRQVGELEPSELVFTLLIADLAAVPMQNTDTPLWAGIVPIFTLLCLTFLLSVLTMKNVWFRAIICGRPSILVDNGKICQSEMRKNRVTLDELSEELRIQGVSDIKTVRYAILETNGQLSVLLKAAQAPLTAAQAGVTPQEPGLSVLIVSDGRLLTHNLMGRGLNREWLDHELKRHHVKDIKEVFALSVNESGDVYFAPKERREKSLKT